MDQNQNADEAPTSGSDATSGYSVEELAELGEVPVRTVRFYIAQGVLPGPGSRGRAATYSDEHLVRLRLIRRLAERRVPLTEMRELLAPLTLEEARALLVEEEEHTAALRQAAQAPSPKEYIAALLSRAQAASQQGESAGPAWKMRRGSAPPGQEQRISDQPLISQPPLGSVPRPLGPTPPAQKPLAEPDSKSYPNPKRKAPFPWRESHPSKERAQSGSEPASAWQRWELAPGLELHVRVEAVERYRNLIRRLLRAAGLSDQLDEDEP